MKIFFRCRGGKFQGWGNVVRLAHIANYIYIYKKFDVFFIYEGDKELKKFLKSFKFKKIFLNEEIQLNKEKSILKKIGKPDITFMEMLEANLNLQYFYQSISKKFIIMDDLLDKIYISDYLICCQSQNVEKKNILKLEKTKLFIGNKYFPFNEKLRSGINEKKLKKDISNILVFLGGGNYENALLKCGLALKSVKFNKAKFIVSPNINNKLKRQIKSISKRFSIQSSVKDVHRLFKNIDLAIVSGGYTKFESAMMKVPSLIIQTQWHQKNISEKFSYSTGCPNLGHMSNLSIKRIVSKINSLKSLRVRRSIIRNYKRVVNENGVNEILKVVGILS